MALVAQRPLTANGVSYQPGDVVPEDGWPDSSLRAALKTEVLARVNDSDLPKTPAKNTPQKPKEKVNAEG